MWLVCVRQRNWKEKRGELQLSQTVMCSISRNTFWIFGLRMRAAQELTAKQPGDVCSPIHPERKGVWLTFCLDSFGPCSLKLHWAQEALRIFLSVCLSIYLSLLWYINLPKWKLNYIIAMGIYVCDVLWSWHLLYYSSCLVHHFPPVTIFTSERASLSCSYTRVNLVTRKNSSV